MTYSSPEPPYEAPGGVDGACPVTSSASATPEEMRRAQPYVVGHLLDTHGDPFGMYDLSKPEDLSMEALYGAAISMLHTTLAALSQVNRCTSTDMIIRLANALPE